MKNPHLRGPIGQLPFSGPPSSLPLFEPTEEGLDAPSRTQEERTRMAMINRGIHHRLVAHRAIEETRRAATLMWVAVLLWIPIFLLGMWSSSFLIMFWSPSMNTRGWFFSMCVGAGFGYLCFAISGDAKRLVNLVVERFGKRLWE